MLKCIYNYTSSREFSTLVKASCNMCMCCLGLSCRIAMPVCIIIVVRSSKYHFKPRVLPQSIPSSSPRTHACSVHHNRKWYDPQGSGPLRVLALLLFWLFCFPCLGCYMCHTKCLVIRMIWFCCSLCYDLDDWGNDSDGSDDS